MLTGIYPSLVYPNPTPKNEVRWGISLSFLVGVLALGFDSLTIVLFAPDVHFCRSEF